MFSPDGGSTKWRGIAAHWSAAPATGGSWENGILLLALVAIGAFTVLLAAAFAPDEDTTNDRP